MEENMYRHIEEKVSQMTGAEIIRFKNKIGFYYFLFALLMLALYLYFAVIEIPFLYWLAILAIPISFIFFLPVLSSIDEGYKKILSEHLDIDRYQDIIEGFSFFKSGRPGSRNRAEKSFYYLNTAYLQFLRGNFLASLEELSEIQPTDFRVKKQENTVFYYYLQALDKIFLSQTYNLSVILEQMTSQEFKSEKAKKKAQLRIETVLALDKIVTKHEACDYFEHLESDNKLDKVLRTYYAGLNDLNQGKNDQALDLFSSITDENPALFIVKEAKKYIEEN